MAQASFPWQQWVHRMGHKRHRSPGSLQPALPLKWLKGKAGWFAGAIAYTLLLDWQRPLVLSITMGVLTLEAVTLAKRRRWHHALAQWQRRWQATDRSLILTLGSSFTVMVATYLTVSLWAAVENHWLAMALVLQGLLTCVVLGLLLLQFSQPKQPNKSAQQDSELLADLVHPDPLKRLMAVRNLPRHFTTVQLNQPYVGLPQTSLRSHLVDCLHIMLNHEADPIVRSAVLDTLPVLNPIDRLGQGTESFALPTPTKSSQLTSER